MINGVLYKKDLIIYNNLIIPNWKRRRGHSLEINDLKDVLKYRPQTIIIGTGLLGRLKIQPETRNYIEKSGIELIIKNSKQACQIFNQKCDGDRTVLAIHLTC